MIRGTQQAANVPSYQPPSANTAPQAKQALPWRIATDRKTQTSIVNTFTLGAAAQPDTHVLDGTGFLEYVDIDVHGVTAGNAAAVTFAADGPWNVLTNITLKANGPEIFNLDGWALHLLNLYGGFGLPNYALSADTLVYQALAGAGGGLGGSFRVKYRLPLALNGRSLIGVVGNQDRGTKYELRTDVNLNAAIYGVTPTAPPVVTVTRTLGYCTIPASVNANGQQQQQVPPHYGVFHYANVLTSESAAASASSQNHFIRGLGNIARVFILEWRDSTGARSDLAVPTNLAFSIGQDVWFNETPQQRRQIMYERYGIDAPPGVLVYDFVTDMERIAGWEYGNDWLNTRNVNEAQFRVTYPTFAATPGLLRVISDSLSVPAGIDLLKYT